jgi:hypothetical protein
MAVPQLPLMMNAATLKSLNCSWMIESMWKTILRRTNSVRNSSRARSGSISHLIDKSI